MKDFDLFKAHATLGVVVVPVAVQVLQLVRLEVVVDTEPTPPFFRPKKKSVRKSCSGHFDWRMLPLVTFSIISLKSSLLGVSTITPALMPPYPVAGTVKEDMEEGVRIYKA